MNPLLDPDNRPAGFVPIRCSEHGTFVAWCSPPAPACRVGCTRDCPPGPGMVRQVPLLLLSPTPEYRWNVAEQKPEICVWCGRSDTLMVPVAFGRSGEQFACAEECRTEEEIRDAR